MEELGASNPAEGRYDLVRPYVIGVVADLPRSTSDGWYVPAGRIIAPVLDEPPAYMTGSGQPSTTKPSVHPGPVAIGFAAAFFALISLALLGGSSHGPAVLAAKCGSSGCQLGAPQSPITVFRATINSGHRSHSSSTRSAMQADNVSQDDAVTTTTPSASLTGSGSPSATVQSCGPMTSPWFGGQPWGNTCLPRGSGMPRSNQRGPGGPGSSGPRGTR